MITNSEKVLHVTLPTDLHELAVYTQTHTINAVNKFKEFADSASKAYPALLEMEKRFTKFNGQPTDLGDGFGVMGWHEFLNACHIPPVNFRVWKSRMKATIAKKQREKADAIQTAIDVAAAKQKALEVKVLEKQLDTAQAALVEAKVKLDTITTQAMAAENTDADFSDAKAEAEAEVEATEKVKANLLKLIPKPPTTKTLTAEPLNVWDVHDAKSGVFVLAHNAEEAKAIAAALVIPVISVGEPVNLTMGDNYVWGYLIDKRGNYKLVPEVSKQDGTEIAIKDGKFVVLNGGKSTVAA